MANTFSGGAQRRSAILLACLLLFGVSAFADATTSIATNFNSTSIGAGKTIWFTAVTQTSSLGTNPVRLFVRKSTITFTANGVTYKIPAPDTNIIYDPKGTTATVTFNAAINQWQVYRLSSTSDFTLLSAVEFTVPQGGLPGGIKNVTWQMNLSTDTAGVGVKWMWAAAVYPTFSTDYNALGVKPCDDQTLSQYKNTDHAGCPENYKQYVIAGGTGPGGTSCVGMYTSTVVVNPPVVTAPTAKAGGPYSGYAGQTISFNGGASTDPDGYPLNYSWNFGDGTTATGATPTHVYSSAGTFTVTLTVDDGRNVTGSSTATATITLPPAPTITATVTPAPNAAGWNNTNVTVTFTCADSNVGIRSCTAPITVSTDGANQIVQGTAVNNGGVSSTTSVKVSIDKTKPTITATPSPAANAAGWNNSNVTVTFTCTDSLSGIAQCPQPILVSASGANQIVSGTTTDVAGNTATASVTLNVELTLPNITASVSPAPNTHGWNNTNVTVSFTCTPSTSPVTNCPGPQTISTEGAGQTVTGAVTDAAGDTNTAKVTLNIAKVPPQITAAVSPQPNANGWNNSAVTVTFTCTKTTAPLATCPQAQTITTEGANQVVSGTVTDVAGNSATVQVSLNLATTPPAITAALLPQPNANGWNNSAVTVTFMCSKTTAPIANCPQAQTISTEGAGQVVTGTVTDVAGNSAATRVTLNIALTPPTITATASPAPNANGWNNAAVTVSFSCTATTAPLATCPPPQTVSKEGAGQVVTGTATDVAGNSATAKVTLNIGTTSPTILPVISPAPNAAGWNNSAVTVSFICTAGTAPVATCPAPVAVSAEGANQQVCGQGVDAAGNPSAPVCAIVNIDRTPPTITGAINPAPNAAGWNNTAVTVSFTCSDTLSGIATCPAPVQLATEGANQAVTGTAVDKAGNVAQATVTVNIDKTPPVITGTPAPAPNAAGWNTTDVTITYTCSDSLSGVLQCPPARTVSTEGKAQQITATVSDIAGNTATSTVLLNIEKTAPAITASFAPPANAAGWNNSNLTVSFVCTPSASDIVSCQTPISVTTEGKGQVVPGTVTDQAGKSNTATATVNIDKTPPLISANTAPPPNAAGWNNTNVVISFLCSDSLSGISICPSPLTVSTEGAAQQFTAQAADQAGNTSAVTTTLNIDKTPPTVTAAAAPPPNSAGWNNSNVTVTFTCTDSLSGVASCPPQQLVASEGQNQNISGQATDVAGNVATGSITLSIDKTPPTIVQLSTPDHISRLHGGQISVIVNDNFFVSQVVISVNGTSLGTFTSAPYQAALQVPAGSNPGDTLTVTAVATDEAGNTQSASRAVRVAADGVIVGQVLSDVTSFPIQGAAVQTISTTSVSDQTDDHGRYSLQASDSHLFLSATSISPATTTVEREVFVQSGVGTVPVDARLTPLSAPVTIGSAGGTVTAGNITITVFPGTVADGTTFQLTLLSGQGLPGLLPLGWTPFAAFDLRASSSVTNLSTAISKIPNTVLHLVTYNPALHAWTMVTPGIAAQGGGTGVFLPSTGSYALVFPDPMTPPITIPNPGSPLPGIPMQLLDAAASSSGSLSPAIVPPSGGTSIATLGVQSATPVPSGTVIQANISEKFSLKSGDVVSEESRSEDIVLYGALAPTNATLGALFPVTPSQKYTNTQLLTGKVHLDILAGREGVRGQPGGSNPVTLTDGIATLSVPGGALSQDTAINVQGIAPEDFVPSNGSIGALQEVLVDFSGETLNTPGQLSISATALNPAHTFLLTQVQRIDGVPHMVLVALAQISGANLTSVASPGLPGITQGGEYVFYDVSAPIGFVQGVVSSSAGPVQALVQTDSLPIVSITGADGKYIVPAIAGTANLKASSPHTNLAGSASVQVTAGQTTQASISLAGTVTSAVVSPADGTLGVPVSTTITVTTTAPLNPQSISQANLVLLQGNASSGTPVPVGPFVLSSSGTVLSFAPVANLNPATQYTIQVAGLADTFGGAVVVPVSSFTTQAVVPPNFDPNAITFSFPDTNGNVQVTAPAGSLPPGTKVLIVDATNASVLSLTAGNDGSLSGSIQATINDLLQITVTDPVGATTSFQRSQFVAPDGTTAIGPGGGTVTGPGGVELRIPAGALEQGATFKISGFGPDAFADRPNFAPEAIFASGLHISASGVTPFKQEVKLVFPKPAAASPNAAYFVFRRLQGTDGASQVYEVIDEASLEGTGDSAKVVTNSPPYRGFVNLTNAFNNLSNSVPTAVGGVQANIDFLLDYADALVNSFRMQSGVVTGVVFQAQIGTNGGSTTFVPVADATVQAADDPLLVDPNTKLTVTTTDTQGHFVLWDPNYDGGNRRLVVTPAGGGQPITVTAHEVTPGDDLSILDTVVFAAMAKLFKRFRNVAYVNATFPALPPPPSAPALQIQLYQASASGPQLLSGVAPALTDLTVTVRSTTADIPYVSVQDLGAPNATPQNVAMAPAGADGNISLFNGTYNASHQGLFRITATVIPPLGGAPVTATLDFRAIQGTFNGNNVDDPNNPPTILSTIPKDGNQQVDLHVNPQVFFSEPVTNISPATVIFTDADLNQVIPLDISGVTPDGLVVDPVTPTTIVTSILLQPLQLLEYNHHYSLTFSTLIVDTDKDQNGNPAPKNLISRPPIVFQTQSPEVEARPGSNLFSSPGVFVANNFAFYEQVGPTMDSGSMRIFDIGNPVQPREVTSILPFLGRVILGKPSVVTGETNNSYVTNGGPTPKALIAIGASSYANPRPSNIHLYTDEKAANGKGKWIGSVSVSTEPIDGMLNSIAVKGSLVYGAVWRKGIVVVDVPTVVQDVQSTTGLDSLLSDLDALLGSNLSSVNFNLYTEGRGYATDAVVNTIPVSQNVPCPPGSNSVNPNGTCNEEFNAYIYNIKASDYSIAGESATWVIGTGMVLPPSNAPAGTGSTTVVAVNPTTNEVFRSAPSGNNITLLRGTALALGTVQNPNLPNLSNVAVVVGQGSAGSSVMFVLDMTDPRFPVTLSVTTLDLSLPSDVLLRDKVVAVAFQHVTEFYDISDPTHPQPLGKVGSDSDPVGGHLAFSSDGTLLLSTNFVPGNFSDASGGVHITDFGSGAYVNFIPPVLAKEDDPSQPNSTRTNEVNFNITTVMVPVATQVKSAQLQLFNSSGVAVACNGQPVCPVSLTGTAGTVSFNLGALTGQPADLSAQVTYFLSNGDKLISSKQPFHLGIVKILADLNNDTVVDDRDQTIQRSNVTAADAAKKRFSFWQGDSSKLNLGVIDTQDPGVGTIVNSNVQEDALQDYATLKIHAEALPPAGYKLGIKLQSATWALTEKAPGPTSCTNPGCSQVNIPNLLKSKEHLSDSNTMQKQLAKLNNGNNLCHNLNDSTGAPGECISDGSGFLELDNLSLGDTVALFRCSNCGTTGTDTNTGIATGNRSMEVQVQQTGGSTTQVLDHLDVDFRPLQQWMTVYTIRTTPTPQSLNDFRPASQAKLMAGWMDVPATAKNITVGIHGFDVSEPGATGRFYPAYFKRFYWIGRPVIAPQDPDGLGPAHFVGVAWPGDEGAQRTFLLSSTNLAQVTYFPEDEMRALESGIPIAAFLEKLYSGGGRSGVTLNLLSHSLGNMVVNSALTRSGKAEMPTARLTNYVMNEAAIPMEAFSKDYVPTPAEEQALLFGAQKYGYAKPNPDGTPSMCLNLDGTTTPCIDNRWRLEFNDISAGIPFKTVMHDMAPDTQEPDCTDALNWHQQLCGSVFFVDIGRTTCSDLTDFSRGCASPYYTTPLPNYSLRWSQVRPGGPDGDVPDSVDASSTPQRGPWRGFFGKNLSRTRMLNTFNIGDQALQTAWYASQIAQKPNVGFLGLGADGRSTQFWAKLANTDSSEEALFSNGGSHSNLIRQWAELAHWFQSLSGPMGAAGFPNFSANPGNQSQNCNFTTFAPTGFTISHGYLHSASFSQVWQAWGYVKDFMHGDTPNCLP